MSAGKGVVPTGSAAIINPGHVLHGDPDPGAVNPGTGLRESDVAANIGDLAVNYLARAVQQRLVRNLQAVDEGNRTIPTPSPGPSPAVSRTTSSGRYAGA